MSMVRVVSPVEANCQTFSTGFNSGDVAGRFVKPTGLIDDQHRMGAGIDGGTLMRCAAMASVSHQGMTSPAPFPFARAEDIGPFGALVAGRPRARATSGPSV